MTHNRIALIVAGGIGSRMNADVPKQFLEVAGKPILMHTIENFYNFDNTIRIIVVLSESQMPIWSELCKIYSFTINHKTIVGGKERFYSVQNGLYSLEENNAIVAIHDGVRPLVSHDTLQRCFELADDAYGIIPAISLNDSIRKINHAGKSEHVDRNLYRAIQTPQTFYVHAIKRAYMQEYSPIFTDDASVFEADGGKINLVTGNVENIKVTTPSDIIYLKAIIKQQKI